MDRPLEIVAFFAHPDDETMLCGGTLRLLADQGARVHLLIATRGEGGEMGEPPMCAREQLGQAGKVNRRCAISTGGTASLTLLVYTAPRVAPGDALFLSTDVGDARAA